MPLSKEQAKALLIEDANKPRGGGRGTKPDPTLVRDVVTWLKLNHHFCMKECEHRSLPGNTTGKACWNPNCVDPRLADDVGTNMVSPVRDQWICRYCFLDGYLLVIPTND